MLYLSKSLFYSESFKRIFVDPIVGLDYRTGLSDKWVFYGRADIGGFGVGSELNWQLGAYFGYKPTQNWNLFGGYRHLAFDYKSDNASQFFYDMSGKFKLYNK